ncbi:MAG: rod shape-determining protein MreD [candidate division FCPU426 bacterium]
MSVVLIALFTLLAVVLQTTWVHALSIAGLGPDLVLLWVLYVALRRQTTLGLWVAFSAGLLQDIAAGGRMGFNAFLLLGVAYVALYLRRRFVQDNFISQLLIVLGFTWLHQFLALFWLNTLLGASLPFGIWLGRAAGLSLFQALLGPWLYLGLDQWLNLREDPHAHHLRLN